MNLCDDDHAEICHEGRTCPLCEMRTEKDGEIDSLKKELSEAEATITKLENQ